MELRIGYCGCFAVIGIVINAMLGSDDVGNNRTTGMKYRVR